MVPSPPPRTVVRFFSLGLTCAVLAGAMRTANAEAPLANAPAIDPRTACATEFTVTTIDGQPNAVVARALDLTGPFTGTITAYGADRSWTAAIGRVAVVDKKYGGQEASVTVRADAPIDGIQYAPAWATCTFHAGARPKSGNEARDVDRPTLAVGNPQPIERVTCRRPYVSATVTHAVEPINPLGNVYGTVRVGVALDERGIPQLTRVIATADQRLNRSAVDAARRSEYAAAIFRCNPIPSGYEFTVDYVDGVGRP